jgi:DNA-binding PadR family transcriptional regulator
MNVRTLCLSILYDGEATGYDIRKASVEGDCSYFVEASFGSIYPALAKLEADQLVTSRIEQQDGKPAKKIYAITEAGRAALRHELCEPLGDDVFRSPFLLFARFAHILPTDIVETRLQERLDHILDEKKKLEGIAADEGCTAADSWIVNYGLACLTAAEQHVRDHMSELIALAQPGSQIKDAAE